MRGLKTTERLPSLYVVDPYLEGHHLLYLSKVAMAAASKADVNLRVVTAGSGLMIHETPEMNEAFLSLVEQRSGRQFFFRSRFLSDVSLGISHWTSLAETLLADGRINSVYPKGIFITWIDSFLGPPVTSWLVSWIIPFDWSGIYFHPRHLRNPQEASRAGTLKAKSCKLVCILDENCGTKLEEEINRKVVIFPDFTDVRLPDSTGLVDELIVKARGRKIIGLMGSLEPRKGVEDFVRWAHQSKESDEFFFVMVGYLYRFQFSEEFLALLDSFSKDDGSFYFKYDSRIESEQVFNAYVNTCDYIYIVYKDFPHSSNLLTKAAYFQKPVLSSDQGLLGQRVSQFGLGVCLTHSDPESLSSGVRELESKDISASAFESYFKEHSDGKFQKKVHEILLELL